MIRQPKKQSWASQILTLNNLCSCWKISWKRRFSNLLRKYQKVAKRYLFPFVCVFNITSKLGDFLKTSRSENNVYISKGTAHWIYLIALLQCLNHLSSRKQTNRWFRPFVPSSLKASFKHRSLDLWKVGKQPLTPLNQSECDLLAHQPIKSWHLHFNFTDWHNSSILNLLIQIPPYTSP